MISSQGKVWTANRGQKRRQEKTIDGSRGFSLVELMVVIAVIVILMAILLPVLGNSRASARRAKCSSHLRQLCSGWQRAMTREPAGPFSTAAWPSRVLSYLDDTVELLDCPDDQAEFDPSYGMNDHAGRFGGRDPGRIVLLEYNQLEIKVVGQTRQTLDVTWETQHQARHGGALNVAFVDGHVELHQPTSIDPRYCELYVRYWRPLVDATIMLPDCLPGDGTSVASTAGSGGPGGAGTAGTSGTTTDSGAPGNSTTTGASTASATGSTTSASGSTSGGSTTGGTATGDSTTTTGTTTGGAAGSAACADCNAFVGATSVTLVGVSYTDSYNSNQGPYSAATAGQSGNVCSNGSISLNGGSMINGSAHPGPGQAVNANTGAVTGSTTPLSGGVSLPPVNFGNAASVNDNANIPRTSRNRNAVSNGAFSLSGNDSLTLPAGTYYFTSFSLTGGSTLSTSGLVIIYCTGDFSAAGGSISNPSQLPGNLRIYCTGATVSLSGASSFHGLVYAPQSAVSRSGGSSECYGALIGNSLTINGSAGVHFDQALIGLFNVNCN